MRRIKEYWLELSLTVCHVVLPIAHLYYEFNFGDLTLRKLIGLNGVFELAETLLGIAALYMFYFIHSKLKKSREP